MTPWFKKRKLHMVAIVTAFGMVVAVIVPTEHKGKAAQVAVSNSYIKTSSLKNEVESYALTVKSSTENQEQDEIEKIDYENELALVPLGEVPMNGLAKAEPTEEELSNILSLTEPVEQSELKFVEGGLTADEKALKQADETTADEGTTAKEAEIAEEEASEQEDDTPAPEFYTIGVKHSSVAEIQQRLMDLGFMDYAEPTQLYGTITAEAVMLFQRQNDLKQDGIIGPETKEMLLSETAKKYTAKLGMSGNDITRIQTRLYEMGYLGDSSQITGVFDESTQNAVIKMQSNNGIDADGKVGSVTAELIYSGEAKANLLSYGDKSDVILACQERLKELGYLTTKPDGSYGNDTVAAVKQFQSRNDLVVDGYLGPTTRDALNGSGAVANGIMLGDSGDTVKRVQELLNKYGYLASKNATGYYGDVTEAAVKAFQANNGLNPDGNVGIKTMAKLTGSDVEKASSSNSGNSSSGSNNNSGSSNDSGNNDSESSEDSEPDSHDTKVTSSSVSALLKVARSKVGKPYVWSSKGPNSFDCSGYVYWCLNQAGVNQSYITSSGWRNVGKYQKVSSFSNIKAGDIVVVRGHVGIAAGDGMVYDASSSSGRIVYRSLGKWWRSNFIVAWRIFG